MPLTQLNGQNSILEMFDDLSGYEKGAVARAFLNDLIKRGSLERDPSDSSPGFSFPFRDGSWSFSLDSTKTMSQKKRRMTRRFFWINSANSVE